MMLALGAQKKISDFFSKPTLPVKRISFLFGIQQPTISY
jgi:hypothetical protein